jgi:hypothetical protein
MKSIIVETRFNVENPSNAKEKNHGHQLATISLSQEFWVTRLWRLTRESSLHKTLARVYVPLHSGPAFGFYGPPLRSIRSPAYILE